MAERSLKHEITDKELYYMRESEGMSNQEIADSLGISSVTVYRRIGKQGFRAKRDIDSMPRAAHRALPEPENTSDACLVVNNIVKYLKGEIGEYCIDPRQKTVMMSIDGVCTMNFNQLETIIKELTAIKNHLGECNPPMEMW